jgi:hypothetical protein
MLLLELPQFLLKDGMVLLKLRMLSLQGSVTLLEGRVFSAHALELLGNCGKLRSGSISGFGGVRSLALHPRRVLSESSKVIFVFGDHHLKFSIFLFGLCQLLLHILFSVIVGRDLPEVAVEDRRSEEGLRVENKVLDNHGCYKDDNQVLEYLPGNAWTTFLLPCFG